MSTFVDDYFEALFEWSPSVATSNGFHQYDSKLEDLSATAVQRRIARLKELQSELMHVRSQPLKADDEIDAEIIDSQIKAELLDMDTLQTWRHNPMNYVGLPGGAIDGLQMFLRPTHHLYRTPVENVYFCSSSTPPGGGVHGMCGYNAAQVALRK